VAIGCDSLHSLIVRIAQKRQRVIKNILVVWYQTSWLLKELLLSFRIKKKEVFSNLMQPSTQY